VNGIGIDAISGVAIAPLDGLGSPVVVTDVAHQLAGQVLNRGEDPACYNIALKLGEPVFDLVEPRRVGRRVVEVQSGVRREELRCTETRKACLCRCGCLF